MENNQLYTIRIFDESTAQVIVEYKDCAPIGIDLPIDENGNVPEGDELDKLIRGFIPVWHFERLEKIKAGIKNASAVHVKVVPYPSSPEPTLEQLAIAAREKRYSLLFECDWTQLADVPLSPEQKQAWSNYRQALRDVTTQAGFPQNIVWPTEP